MHKTGKGYRVGIVVLAFGWGGAVVVGAQGDMPAAPPVWTTTLAAGANATRGNSKTLTLNGSVRSEAKSGANEAVLGAEGNYGEAQQTQADGTTDTQKTVNNVRAFAQYRRLLTDRLFISLNGEALQDDIAGIKYRFTVGPGAGYYLLKDNDNAFKLEAGPTYIAEEDKDSNGATARNNRWALRAAERFERKLSATSKIWELAEYLPALDDFNNYLVNAEAGAEAAMTTRVGLRLVGQYKHNNLPAAGKKADDFALIAGLTVKL